MKHKWSGKFFIVIKNKPLFPASLLFSSSALDLNCRLPLGPEVTILGINYSNISIFFQKTKRLRFISRKKNFDSSDISCRTFHLSAFILLLIWSVAYLISSHGIHSRPLFPEWAAWNRQIFQNTFFSFITHRCSATYYPLLGHQHSATLVLSAPLLKH